MGVQPEILEKLGNPGSKHIVLDEVHLPDNLRLGEVSNTCKFDFKEQMLDGSDTFPAKTLGSVISKASHCTETSGGVVLGNIFGNLINDKSGFTDQDRAGVRLSSSTEVPR